VAVNDTKNDTGSRVTDYSETISLAADTTSSSINVSGRTNPGSLQVNWSGLTGPDAVFSIEGSNDNTNWKTFPGSQHVPPDPSGCVCYDLDIFTSKYIRLKYEAGTADAGSATIYFLGRRV
jgi:hypothetical protein